MQDDLDMLFDVTMLAEIHNVNGAETPVIIDNQRLLELKAKSQYAEGISTAELLFFVKCVDFVVKPTNEQEINFDEDIYGLKPAVGQVITFDNDIYRVVAVTELNGMFEIVLGANW